MPHIGPGLRTGLAVDLAEEVAGGNKHGRRLAQVSRRAQMAEDQEVGRRSPDAVGAGHRADMESGLEEDMANVRAVVVPGCNRCNHSHPGEEEERPIGPGEVVL